MIEDNEGNLYSLDEEPDVDELMSWEERGMCETPDGCMVEPDGTCEHGLDSWMLLMGLI